MTDQEQTERMALGLLDRLSDAEKRAVFRIKRDLERVLRDGGKLSILAFGLLSVDLQSGRKPGQIPVVSVESSPAPSEEPPSPSCAG